MKEFDPFTIGLTALMPLSLLIASILAWPISIWLLRSYHAAVSRSMGATINPVATGDNFKNDPIIPVTYGNAASGPTNVTNTVQNDFYKILAFRPLRAGLTHFVAGIVFALSMASITLLSINEPFYLMRFLMLFVIYLWPAVIAVSIVSASTRQHNLSIFGGYLLVFIITTFILIQKSQTTTFTSLIILWCIKNLPATVFLLIFLQSRVRAVGPMVFAFLTVATLGVLFLPSFIGSIPVLLNAIAGLLFDLGFGATGVMVVLHLVSLILFAVIGWIVLNKIKSRYTKKKMSDQSIILDSTWIVFGLTYSMGLVFSGAYWVFIGLAAIIVYKIIVRYENRMVNRRYGFDQSLSLLFLRVFSLGSRSKDVFNHVSKYWRFVGSIHLISGPDLATTTIEPHEFLDYLSRKLARRFIRNKEQLAIRLSEMDNKPDEDGRYRVNDFFCYNDTWKLVLLNLVGRSKVVLMDVRNFCKQNKGCEYEITELVNLMPVAKVVFVTDKTTDQEFLKSTLDLAFTAMSESSPNKSNRYADVQMIHFADGESGAFRRLLKTLAAAAQNNGNPEMRGRAAISAI